MSITSINETQQSFISLLLSTTEKISGYFSNFLHNLISVTSIPDYLARKLNISDISDTLAESINLIEATSTANKSISEKLPDYIQGGRAIRQAVEMVLLYCNDASSLPLAPPFTCPIFKDMVLATQQHASQLLGNYLPQSINVTMRAQVIDNVFSEQYLQSEALLLP